MTKPKVLHIINSLDPGGAEIMLRNLIAWHDKDKFDIEVVSLTTDGVVGPEIEALGCKVTAINLSIWNFPIALLHLMIAVRRSKADIVQTWMYHSNLLGGLAAHWMLGCPIIWGIHATRLEPSGIKLMTAIMIALNRRLSRSLPVSIIYCSESAKTYHLEIGFCRDKITVLPNGFDLARFKPDKEAYERKRSDLGISSDTKLIGIISRYHQYKDHRNFLLAAKELLKVRDDVRFVGIGRQVDLENPELREIIESHELEKHVLLLGECHHMPEWMAALDIVVMASYTGEAFPMILGEAMACDVPCVATPIGDSRWILGDTGKIVPIRDPEALAAACLEILNGADSGEQSSPRRRIREYFDIVSITARYEQEYADALARNA